MLALGLILLAGGGASRIGFASRIPCGIVMLGLGGAPRLSALSVVRLLYDSLARGLLRSRVGRI